MRTCPLCKEEINEEEWEEDFYSDDAVNDNGRISIREDLCAPCKRFIRSEIRAIENEMHPDETAEEFADHEDNEVEIDE